MWQFVDTKLSCSSILQRLYDWRERGRERTILTLSGFKVILTSFRSTHASEESSTPEKMRIPKGIYSASQWSIKKVIKYKKCPNYCLASKLFRAYRWAQKTLALDYSKSFVSQDLFPRSFRSYFVNHTFENYPGFLFYALTFPSPAHGRKHLLQGKKFSPLQERG